MQDNKPYNEKGKPHGYWIVYLGDTIWYITNFVNGERYGYYFFDWHGRVDKEYYAR